MESVLAGCAAGCAILFCNPFDVVKTRMQLQGELKSSSDFKTVYRNVPHAFYLIVKKEGITALQKGLIPAICFQVISNGVRLVFYEAAVVQNLTINERGKPDVVKSLFCGSISGAVGAFIGSPFYLVKTHMQSCCDKNIVVGFQYRYEGTIHGLKQIYSEGGLKSLWRGWQSAVCRAGFGGSVHLATFTRDIMDAYGVLTDDRLKATFVAGNLSAFTLAVVMYPFDLVATRLYNQELDKFRVGKNYSGLIDCFRKTLKIEGVHGIYKGVFPFYLRAVPHDTLYLILFDKFKEILKKYQNS